MQRAPEVASGQAPYRRAVSQKRSGLRKRGTDRFRAKCLRRRTIRLFVCQVSSVGNNGAFECGFLSAPNQDGNCLPDKGFALDGDFRVASRASKAFLFDENILNGSHPTLAFPGADLLHERETFLMPLFDERLRVSFQFRSGRSGSRRVLEDKPEVEADLLNQ